MIRRITRIIRQRLIRTSPPHSSRHRHHRVRHKEQDNNKHHVYSEHKIQNRDSSQLRLLNITLRRTFNTPRNIQKTMTPLGDKPIDVQREPRLKLPESLKADGGSERSVGDEEPRPAREEQAEEGAQGGDASGERIAVSLEIGRLNRRRGRCGGVVEEEAAGGEGEEEIGGERDEGGGGFGEEEVDGDEEEEEEDGGGVEGGEAVDGGAAFDEGVGVERD